MTPSPPAQGQQSTWQNLLNFLFSRKLLQQQGQGPTQQQPIQQPAYSQQDMSAMAEQAAAQARQRALSDAIMKQKGTK